MSHRRAVPVRRRRSSPGVSMKDYHPAAAVGHEGLARTAAQAVERLEDRTLFAAGVVAWAETPPTVLPVLAVGSVERPEGNVGTKVFEIPVELSAASMQMVTVAYKTVDDTATAPGDYVAAQGTLTFDPGVTRQTVRVTVNGDTTVEPNERFFVRLSEPTNATLAPERSQGNGIIQNDDRTVSAGAIRFSLGNYDVAENGGSRTITVLRVEGSAGAVSVHYATGDGGTATPNSDYTPVEGTLTWADGDTAPKTFTVPVIDDTTPEPAETVPLRLSAPTGGATIAGENPARLTIIDNDRPAPEPPRIAVSNARVLEGNSGTTAATFVLELSRASNQPVSVAYNTADGTATVADGDYQAAQGTVTFAPGQTRREVTVLVNGDTRVEPDETFRLHLSSPVGATPDRENAVGTIVNDDERPPEPPRLTLNNVERAEGNTGTTAFTFEVRLSRPSAQPITVGYATADGTATVADADYRAVRGTLTFEPGQVIKRVTVQVVGDTRFEPNERFFLRLASPTGGATIADGEGVGIIRNDDERPNGVIRFAQGEYSVLENAGSRTITVQRVGGTAGAVSVHYAVLPGTATPGADYKPVEGTLTWAAGDGSVKMFAVPIVDDKLAEGNETVRLLLSSPTGGARIEGANPVRLTIIDDDRPTTPASRG